MAIIEQGRIRSGRDLLRLGIIDWNRLNNYWDNADEASSAIASWLDGAAAMYGVIDHNLSDAPNRGDWPGWKHIGHHPEMGRMYWNYFYHNHKGTLHFSDSPDFQGTLQFKDGSSARFWGDIGQVSASTFMHTIRMLNTNDIWVSVIDSCTQIIIEPQISISRLWSNWYSMILHGSGDQSTNPYKQLQMF